MVKNKTWIDFRVIALLVSVLISYTGFVFAQPTVERPIIASESMVSVKPANNNSGKVIDPKKIERAVKKNNKKQRKRLISLNFENEDLTTIINYLAAQKMVNVILPIQPIVAKVTLSRQEKMSLDDAFDMLYTLLDIAGYTMIYHDDTYIISKSDDRIFQESLPIYIGVPLEALPDTDERIRFVYYFNNIKIPNPPAGPADEIKKIIESILKDQSKPGTAQVIFEPIANAVIVSAKSYNIKVAMQIIAELDKSGFKEILEVVKLVNTSADFVGRFLIEGILANPGSTQQPGFPMPASTEASYFSKTTKVIADPRTNSLLLVGKSEAVTRLRDFIYKYIDIPLESGDSLMHIYDLQYLDAQTFAGDLENIIRVRQVAGQARGATAQSRAFEGVIIAAEKIGEIDKLKTKIGEVGTIFEGGNRLLIAAKKNDWINLKKLIADLDKPQPQVALEVLVVDLSLEGDKALGSQIRNKKDALPKNVNAQAANIEDAVLNTPAAQTLITNLLMFNKTDSSGNPTNLAQRMAPGSLVLSFNDVGTNGIWWVAQILQRYTNSQILSHPHVVTLNHHQASITLKDSRLVPGDAKQNPDGSLTINNVLLNAGIEVDVLPRINLSNTINLQIAIKVDNFLSLSQANNTINKRRIITNATIGNGEILVLGGLVKSRDVDIETKTPLLSKVPLIGWLFKDRKKNNFKDNLMVFISPTVIQPRVGGGMTKSTASKFEFAREDLERLGSNNFEQMRDPITRWFFKNPPDSTLDMIHDFEKGVMFKDIPLKGTEPEFLESEGEQRKDEAVQDQPFNEQKEKESADQLKNMLAAQSSPFKKGTVGTITG